MPRRGERGKFPAGIFKGNPLAKMSPAEAYKYLRWGNAPRQSFTIDAPEPLVALGELAAIILLDRREQRWPDDGRSPYLAVGKNTNIIYFVPRAEDGGPARLVPSGPYYELGLCRRVDYYSDKGGEEAYYYHDHEPPYPVLFYEPRGTMVLLPQAHRGGRSFAVAEGGIVG